MKDRLKLLDPYYYLDNLLLKFFGKPKKTETKIIYWVFYLIYSLLLAFIIFKLLGLILGTTLPLATVVSGSMEPSFYRGDIMVISSTKNLKSEVVTINENIATKNITDFLEMEYEKGIVKTIKINNQLIEVNDAVENNNSVVVYKSNLTGKDIIHRVILIIKANDGKFVLTKGDNNKTNYIIDQDCIISGNYVVNGCLNMYPINVESLLGKKRLRIPYIGYLKLFLFRG